MKSAALFYFLIIVSSVALGQNPIRGTVKYIYTDFNKAEKHFTMHFTVNESMAYTERSAEYKREVTVVEDPDQENHYRRIQKKTDPESETYYRNIERKELVTREMYMLYKGDNIVLKEKLPEIDWIITEESKLIGEFTCYLAKSKYKGRAYNVWFTYDIPVSHGPWKFSGLPGLILEAHDKRERFHFVTEEVQIGVSDFAYPITPPKIGKNVNWSEYVQMYLNAQEVVNKKIDAHMAAKGNGRTGSILLPDFKMSHIEGPAFAAWEKAQQEKEDE